MSDNFVKYLENRIELVTNSKLKNQRLFFIVSAKDQNEALVAKDDVRGIVSKFKDFDKNKIQMGWFVNTNDFMIPEYIKDFDSIINGWNIASLEFDMPVALNSCLEKVFNEENYEKDKDEWENLFFIISSEPIQDLENCANFAVELKNYSTIIVVGNNREFGSKCCSVGSYYSLDNRDKLQLDIAERLNQFIYTGISANLKFFFNRLSKIKESAYIIVEFTNETKSTMNNVIIDFASNAYFERVTLSLDSINSGQTVTREVELKTKQGAGINELVNSSTINFTVFTNNSRVPITCNSKKFHLLPHIFMKEFFYIDKNFTLLKRVDEIRILLNGAVGSGKSSFANILLFIFSMNKSIEHAKVGLTSEGTYTKTIERFIIDRFLNNEFIIPISLKDAWGKELRAQKGREKIKLNKKTISKICKGYWGHGYDPLTYNSSKKIEKKPEELVDIVLFIVAADLINNSQDNVALKKLRKYCRYVHEELKREYVILITKSDMLTNSTGDKFSKIFDPNYEPRQEVLKCFIEGENAVDPKKIFFVSNNKSWPNNEEENLFSQSLSILLLFKYLFTNYGYNMERLMQSDEFVRDYRFKKTKKMIHNNSSRIKKKYFLRKDNNEMIKIDVKRDDFKHTLEEIRKKFDIESNSELVFWNEKENYTFDIQDAFEEESAGENQDSAIVVEVI